MQDMELQEDCAVAEGTEVQECSGCEYSGDMWEFSVVKEDDDDDDGDDDEMG